MSGRLFRRKPLSSGETDAIRTARRNAANCPVPDGVLYSDRTPGVVLAKGTAGAADGNEALSLPAYIPQFDGLRGIAILSVFIAHCERVQELPHARFLQYGRVGVDLFFVLSGFLITGILVESKGSPGYFRNFYARRALRIWPLYYAVLAIIFLLVPNSLVFPEPSEAHNWFYYTFYVQNLFPHYQTPAALGPTWSLAIEEQFYLTWPFVIFLLDRRTLPKILVALVGISLTLRIICFEYGAPMHFTHSFTLCRLDAITLGCLAALFLRSSRCTRVVWRRRSLQAVGLAICGIVISRTLWHEQSTVISYTFLAIGFAGLLGISVLADPAKSVAGRFLTARWLTYTGKISYGLYLIHMPLFVIWAAILHRFAIPLEHSSVGVVTSALVQITLAYIAASLSWRFFEGPILRLKSHFPSAAKLGRPEYAANPAAVPTPQQ